MAIRARIAPLDRPSLMLVARRVRFPSVVRSWMPKPTGMISRSAIRTYFAISSLISLRARLGRLAVAVAASIRWSGSVGLGRRADARPASGAERAWPARSSAGGCLDGLVEHELAVLDDVRAVGA